MRMISKTSVVAAVTALAILSSVFSAEAKPWPHPHWGGHGYWVPGVAVGLIGAIAAGAIVNNCYVQQPIYDGYGNVVGYRPVNTCY